MRFVSQDPRIFTEHLDDNLAIDLRDALQNIVANGLREAGFDAGNSHQSLFHLIDELLFGQSPQPARGRVEIYQELRHVNHLGIGAILRAAGFGDDGSHFRKLTQERSNAGCFPRGFTDRNPWGQHDIDPKTPLVEFRQKFTPETWHERQADNQSDQSDGQHRFSVTERVLKKRTINARANFHQPILLLRYTLS